MRLFALLASLMLGGCSLGPQAPVHGPAPLPVNYSETTGAIPQSPDVRWWSAFRDPALDRVIDEGLSNNLDIRTALLRIDAAEDNIVVAGAGGLPSINFDASHVRSRETGAMKEIGGIVDTTLRGASATWLIDVFGEVRSQVLSAKATRNAAVDAVAIARLMVLSDIATAYIDARYFQELGQIGARAVSSRQHVLSLTRRLAAEGVASRLDVSRTEASVDLVRAELPVYNASFRRSTHRVSTLTGKPATSLLPIFDSARGQPLPGFDPDTGVPADLLRNRPDIRKAEQELVAAVADIGFARAQLFPTITLSGSITSAFIDTDLKNGSLNKWSFGPSLRIPIFEGGRLRANVRIAASLAQQKELAWRSAVLKAVEEVENALVAYNRDRIAVRTQEKRVKAIRDTVRLSMAAYEAGMTSRLDALDAESEMFEAESDLALARRNLAVNFIALNIAAGRGLPGPGRASMAGVAPCGNGGCATAAGTNRIY